MAKRPKSSNTAGIGILGEIQNMLLSIEHGEFIAPDVQPKDGDVIVCAAGDDIKRLFTILSRIKHDLTRTVIQGDEILAEFNKAGSGVLALATSIMEAAKDPSSLQMRAQQAAILVHTVQHYEKLNDIHTVLEALGKAELSRLSPKTYNGGFVTIDCNWNIVRTQVDPYSARRKKRRVLGVLYAAE